MVDDISIDRDFFDPDFFAYREDADVAWRAQLMGWRCIYVPYARGYHVRSVLPGNRRALPPEINMHSVKNRFLMRIKNMTSDLYWRNFFSVTLRDVMVVGWCLLREHSSLQAFWLLARLQGCRQGERAWHKAFLSCRRLGNARRFGSRERCWKLHFGRQGSSWLLANRAPWSLARRKSAPERRVTR